MNYSKAMKKLLLLASVLSVTALFPIAANALCCGLDKANFAAKPNGSDVSSGNQGAPEKGKGLIVPGKGSVVPGKEGNFPRLIDVTKQ